MIQRCCCEKMGILGEIKVNVSLASAKLLLRPVVTTLDQLSKPLHKYVFTLKSLALVCLFLSQISAKLVKDYRFFDKFFTAV